ncbi:MAG: hypothetical protein HXY50_14920 [Ignavibacteriaceae bacterium]|nr:hypothetical protein [Ignavibacteriaceae bacterium]
MFDEEKYYDAITEFKRLQFFDNQKLYGYLSNKMIALSYKHGGKFNDAVKYLSKAELLAPNSDSLFAIKIEIVKINLLRKTTFRARDILEDLKKDTSFAGKENQIIYWKAWTFIFEEQWDKAAELFGILDQNHELKRLCNNTHDMSYSPQIAKILSTIIPGAGQFYTANLLSGLLSLGWVTLWTYLSAQAFLADRVFDGLMMLNFLDFRFYNGNIQNAEKFAVEHNREISDWMLNYLCNNYRGEKP